MVAFHLPIVGRNITVYVHILRNEILEIKFHSQKINIHPRIFNADTGTLSMA